MSLKHSQVASVVLRADATSTHHPTGLFGLLAMITVLSVFEGLAFLFFEHFGSRFSFPEPQRYVADAQALHRARAIFDPDLGWRRRYDTPYGERPRARRYGRPWIATYGDSFTHGDEVGHDETWSEALASRLAADVYNFGNSAYGMDQTLLRFERETARRPTEHAVFAFISNDIQRNLTRYWRFLQPDSRWSLTKPRFRLDGDRLVLVPNPLRREDELRLLREPAFIARIGRGDWYYDRHRLPARRAPYVRLLLHSGFWHAVFEQGRETDLWDRPGPLRLAEHILLRFGRGCRDSGIVPTIVHLPVLNEVLQYGAQGVVPPAVERTRALCERQGLRCVFPLYALRGTPEQTARLFTRGLDGGHYSPQGHRRIAVALEAVLRPPAAADAIGARGDGSPSPRRASR